jgi:hypothetical protein
LGRCFRIDKQVVPNGFSMLANRASLRLTGAGTNEHAAEQFGAGEPER